MELHVFYHLFANLPLKHREEPLEKLVIPYREVQTVGEAYFKVKDLLEEIRQREADIERFIEACEPALKNSLAYKD